MTLGLFALCIGASAAVAEDLELVFEISSSQSGILVRGRANGKPVLLILDTVASRTILARDLVHRVARPALPPRFSPDGSGLNARGPYTETTLGLGDRLS